MRFFIRELIDSTDKELTKKSEIIWGKGANSKRVMTTKIPLIQYRNPTSKMNSVK